MADPDAYIGQVVRVEGLITGVCEKRGCWISLASDEEFQELRIKVDDGVMVFPIEAKGKRAIAEGEFTEISMTMEQTLAYKKHHAEEHNKEFDPSTITRIPSFFPVGVPRLDDDEAPSQGQWGAALRYYAQPIETEFGLYYLRIHDKNPSVGFEAEPFDFFADTFLIPESFPDVWFGLPIRENLPTGPVARTPQTAGVPVGYFREYPDDIDIFAASFANGTPIAFETKGTVRDARGLTSIT